jgi:hypothetical protein
MTSRMLKWLAGTLLVVTVSGCGGSSGSSQSAGSPSPANATVQTSPHSTRTSAEADNSATSKGTAKDTRQGATPADKAEAEKSVNELTNALNQLN